MISDEPFFWIESAWRRVPSLGSMVNFCIRKPCQFFGHRVSFYRAKLLSKSSCSRDSSINENVFNVSKAGNTPRPGDTHRRQETTPSLVQIMPSRLAGAKPLSEPMPMLIKPLGANLCEFLIELQRLSYTQMNMKCRPQIGDDFVPVPMW